MKRAVAFLVVIFVLILVLTRVFSQAKLPSSSKNIPLNTPSEVYSPTTTLFVPYWTLDSKALPANFSTIVYFGVSANMSGVDTTEAGYRKLSQFAGAVRKNQKTLLAIRLLDQPTDEKILHDNAFQQKVISQSLLAAKQYKFDGIILDLEYKALAFDEVVKGITDFSARFAESTHKEHMLFYETFYGDTFYRLRPFDTQAIGKISDGVFVMAYDFHKANGSPGPNFPLDELSDESYSFKQMVNDFSRKVPSQKITIIFGLFGYDWQVNDKGSSVKQADTITSLEASQKFLSNCLLKKCIVKRNATASEIEVTYEDSEKNSHIVWFEDKESKNAKEEYMKSRKIFSTASWAYSYF